MDFICSVWPTGFLGMILNRRPTVVKKGTSQTPFDLPDNYYQCAHVEVEELAEGINYRRCQSDTDSTSRCGFLCREHQYILNPRVVRPGPLTPDQIDDQVIEGIIKSEARILAKTARTKIHLGDGAYLQLVKD